MIETPIGSATTISGVVLGWVLQRSSSVADRRGRAAGCLSRVCAELSWAAAQLNVLPTAATAGHSRLQDTAYEDHREILAELLDQRLLNTIEQAYDQVRKANEIFGKETFVRRRGA